MTEHEVNPPSGDRRVDLEKRRRVAEMSAEEMQRALLTSEVTGLPNRRAFDEAGLASAVAIVVERAGGNTLRFKGADFSYGVGEDLAEAEVGLKSHKADRKARGELERGKLCGIRRIESPENAAPCTKFDSPFATEAG